MSFTLKSAVLSVVSFAVMASLTASAQAIDRAAAQTEVSQDQLAALGLSGLQPMSEQEARDVRGSGFIIAFRSRTVLKSSISFRGLGLAFKHKFKFVLVTRFRAFLFHGAARFNNVNVGSGNVRAGGFAASAGGI
jgi:hypothetical protein